MRRLFLALLFTPWAHISASFLDINAGYAIPSSESSDCSSVQLYYGNRCRVGGLSLGFNLWFLGGPTLAIGSGNAVLNLFDGVGYVNGQPVSLSNMYGAHTVEVKADGETFFAGLGDGLAWEIDGQGAVPYSNAMVVFAGFHLFKEKWACDFLFRIYSFKGTKVSFAESEWKLVFYPAVQISF